MPVRDEAARIAGDIAELRHAIHREPEIGLDLPKTHRVLPVTPVPGRAGPDIRVGISRLEGGGSLAVGGLPVPFP